MKLEVVGIFRADELKKNEIFSRENRPENFDYLRKEKIGKIIDPLSFLIFLLFFLHELIRYFVESCTQEEIQRV